ncbi:hydroxypyruvate reductase [Prunus dulcis]|uniref:Hydroxypyruvate reductase n=1 Tax=Prunus dulcis TaxID=3755 RepID=A0A4Y1RW78_PRUDU|nr:hydroxypyruvate reductase [Prunus dulcis]
MAYLRISILVLSLVFLSFAFSEAKEVIVGGKDISWNVDSSKTLNKWVQNKRFRVGDQLKWKSDKDSDSVLQVTKEDYESCETSKPVKANVTEITLDQAGPFYFISGVKEHCDKGLKLVAIAKPPIHVSPSPSPATLQGQLQGQLHHHPPMRQRALGSVWNPNGKYRVVSTKPMPGTRWINLLIEQDCRVEICTRKKTILSVEDIIALIGDKCDGLTEDWGETLFSALSRAGGKAFSNMAVGYNNVDVNAANKYGVAVGNTPGVLTETTAELAASLSLSAARRIVEADEFMRAGLYDGWLPNLFVGNLLKGQTVGVIGAGRIGSAYARMMVEAYAEFLKANGEQPVTWKRAASMDEVLREADVISLHPILDKTTYHLVNKERLAIMKKEAILVNCSRGPVIDEVALVEHLKQNPMFRVGLDVFEDEPYMKPGLADLKNAVVVPHIASASKWTREGMATLAALNVLGKIKGYPVWSDPNRIEPFLNENVPPPAASPSIVNSKSLGTGKVASETSH